MTITCLGNGAAGFTSPSGSGMSSFLISLKRYPVIQVHFEFILLIYFGELSLAHTICLFLSIDQAQSQHIKVKTHLTE